MQRVALEDYRERKQKRRANQALRRQAVIKFLREHPGSTAEQIWEACKCGPSEHEAWIFYRKNDQVAGWYVNEEKIKRVINNINSNQ